MTAFKAHSQNLAFPIHAISDIPYVNLPEMSKDYKKYPYVDLVVLVRNASQLTSEQFVKTHFRSVKYFYGELKLNSSETNSQKIPLFLYEKNNKKFNTSNIEDKTVIRKYIYNPETNKSLDAEFSTAITVENDLLKFINNLSKVIGPLIKNPTNLLSKDAALKAYDFLDDVLDKASQETTLESQVSFDMFEPVYKKILGYKIFILAPTLTSIPINKLRLSKSATGSFQIVYENGSPFLAFPYVILLKTLNNYNGHSEYIPSNRITSIGFTNINSTDIRKMDSALLVNRSQLSDQQYFAENILLSHLRIISNLEVATSSVDEADKMEELKTAFNDVEKLDLITPTIKSIEKELYTDEKIAMQVKLRGMNDIITAYKKRLPYNDDFIQLRNLVASGATEISNNKLGSITSIVARLEKVAYLKQNVVILNSKDKIKRIEDEMYLKHFKEVCDRLKEADEVNITYSDLQSSLLSVSLSYGNCNSCMIQSKAAISKYTELISGDELRKLNVSIRDTLFYCNDILKTYKRKVELYHSLPDSLRSSIALKSDIKMLKNEIDEIERKINEVSSISKISFNARERREIYNQLSDLKITTNRFDNYNRSSFSKINDFVGL